MQPSNFLSRLLTQRRITGAALCLTLAAGVGGWILMPKIEEVTCHGKTVRAWFYSLDVSVSSVRDFAIINRSGASAIKAMKREAVPFLLTELEKDDSELHNEIFSWLNCLSLGLIMSDEEKQRRIFFCFKVLGNDAETAVPKLIDLSRNARVNALAPFLLNMIDHEAGVRAGVI